MFRKKTKTPPPRIPTASSRTNPVFSYYAGRSRPEVPTGRYEESTTSSSNRWLQYSPSALAALVLVICLLYGLTLSSSPRIINKAVVTPNVLRPDNEYREAISTILKKDINNRSKVTIDTAKLATKIKHEYPEIGAVNVTIPLISRRPIVQLSPAQPALLLASQTGVYVIDADGRALRRLSDLPVVKQLQLPKVTDQVGIAIEPGGYALPKKSVSFISQVIAQLKAKGITPSSMELPAVANELHVHVAGKGHYIKFNLQNDPRQQVGTYLAAVESASNIAEYVDVRVDERAYIK